MLTADVFMQATNSLGPSDWTAVSTFMTQPGLPAQPQPPQLSSSTPATLAVRWQRPADGGAEITDYQLECEDGSSSGSGYRRVYTGPAQEHTLPGLQVGSLQLHCTLSSSEQLALRRHCLCRHTSAGLQLTAS